MSMQAVAVSPFFIAHNVLQIGDCAEYNEPKLMEQIQIKNNNQDLHNVGIATNLRVMFSLLLRGLLNKFLCIKHH